MSVISFVKDRAKEAIKPAQRTWNLGTIPFRKRAIGATPHDVVHRENKWTLLRYHARPAGCAFSTPVLLVPSLINRHYVLDLAPGKSLVEFLVAQGHDVFVIDWGKPGREDRFLTFDDVCGRYLGRAIREAARRSRRAGLASLAAEPWRRSPNDQVHVLGYCLGGTLAAIHTAANPKHVASLVALAAPVTFHDDGLLSRWVRSGSFDINLLVNALGNVPPALMQAAFQMLRPTLALSKLVHTLDRSWNREFVDGFVALETWGNDNIPFPGEVFRTYLEELYRKDAFAQGTFRLDGRAAKMESIRCPVLAITFEHDNIVPWKSAAHLLDRVSSADTQRIHLPGGHVGAVVARAAAKGLWPQLSDFWARRDAPARSLRRSA